MNDEQRKVFGVFDGCTDVKQVADKLRTLGVKGRPHRSCSCPIANFLKGRGFLSVVVGAMAAEFLDGLAERHDVMLPVPLMDFIVVFDRGEIPDLIEV